jgi:signal transduction histidine kinase
LPNSQLNNPLSDLLETRSFVALATALREQGANIVLRWEEMVRTVLPAADHLTLGQVRDQIPATLARLADALQSHDSKETRDLMGQTIGHGKERFHQGYNVEELIVEYRLLRRVVIEETESALKRRTSVEEDLALSMGVDTVLQQGIVIFVAHLRDELRASADAESRFLAYLSHDLRNQLNHSMLVLQLLTSKLKTEPRFAEDVEELERVRRSIFETIGGMEQLLQAERLRKGDITVESQPVDLTELVSGVANQFSHAADKRGLGLEVHIPPHAHCQSDRQLLWLILQNLVSNAIKYSDKGTVQIAVSACDNDAWCIAVSDEGPGIPLEQQQKLFEEFVRGDTRGQPGIGLGLAIASRAAKLLRGKLTVESAPGKGSTFRVLCPRKITGKAPQFSGSE